MITALLYAALLSASVSGKEVIQVAVRGTIPEVERFLNASLNHIESYLKATYDISMNRTFISMSNGTWQDIIDDTSKGIWDLSAVRWFATYPRAKQVAFTVPLTTASLSIVVRHKPQQDALLIVHPFSSLLWGAVFACMFVGAGLYYWGSPKRGAKHTPKRANDSLWWAISLPLQDPQPAPNSFLLRIGTWCIKAFWVIIVIVYTANLTAILTVLNSKAQISSVQELQIRNALVGLNTGSATAHWANEHGITRHVDIDDTIEGLAAVENGTVEGFILSEARINWGIRKYMREHNNHCPFATTGADNARPVHFATPKFRQNLTDAISEAILMFTDDGTIKRLQEEHMPRVQCSHSPQDGIPVRSQTSTFILFGFGCLLLIASWGHRQLSHKCPTGNSSTTEPTNGELKTQLDSLMHRFDEQQGRLEQVVDVWLSSREKNSCVTEKLQNEVSRGKAVRSTIGLINQEVQGTPQQRLAFGGQGHFMNQGVGGSHNHNEEANNTQNSNHRAASYLDDNTNGVVYSPASMYSTLGYSHQ